MPLSEHGVGELVRESDVYGEQAAVYLLDGRPDQALGCAHRAIQAHDELWHALGRDPRLPQASRVYADRLRDRAEIRRELCLQQTDPRALPGICVPALDDCARAIALHEDGGAPGHDDRPLWLPGVRLLAAEFYAWLGEVNAARAETAAAVAGYRTCNDGGERSGTALGQALARGADLLWICRADQEALELRREAVVAYRPHVGRRSTLWAHRHDEGPTWAATPTFARFCRTAHRLAEHQEPPTLQAAGDVLMALQDAVEGYAEMVPVYAYPFHQPSTGMTGFTAAALSMQRWLAALGEADLARRYYAAYRGSAPRTPHDERWAAPVRRMREELDEFAARCWA